IRTLLAMAVLCSCGETSMSELPPLAQSAAYILSGGEGRFPPDNSYRGRAGEALASAAGNIEVVSERDCIVRVHDHPSWRYGLPSYREYDFKSLALGGTRSAVVFIGGKRFVALSLYSEGPVICEVGRGRICRNEFMVGVTPENLQRVTAELQR